MTRNPGTNALAWLRQKFINQLNDEEDCIYNEVVLQKKDLKLKICHPLRYNMSHGFHLFVVCALSWFGSVASGPRSSRGSCEYSVFYWLYINV